MKLYKNHKSVPSKYKWDLDFLLGGKSVEENIKNLLKEYKKLIEIKDHIYDSPENFLASLKLEDKLFLKYTKISTYIRSRMALDVTDEYISSISEDYEYKVQKFNEELGATTAMFYENADKIAKWAKLPAFKEFKYNLESRLEDAKYQLPKHLEEFRNVSSRADISSEEYFNLINYSELNYGFATSLKGKKIKITDANISKLQKSPDKSIRKTSTLEYKKAILRHKESLASALYQHRKSESTWSKILKYPSTVDSFIFDDRVTKQFLTTLYESTKSNKGPNELISKYYKKFYEARFKEKMTKYDRARELTTSKTSFSIEEGISDFLKSIEPFGEEYVNMVKKGLDENWVDFMNIKNKETGAYSDGNFGIEKKLILMNWQDDLHSVETLAHEFGHSMHSYYSEKHQTLRNADYSVFVAEIASIFNELMLHDYWLNSDRDEKFKFAILTQKIKGFNRTVFETSCLSEYEFNMYEALDRGEPVGSYEAQAKIYFDVAKQYMNKPPKKFKPEDNTEAIIVPHFYYEFYLYKYAVGHLVATIFFQKYKEEGPRVLEEYISKFLSLGGSMDNLDILKNAGIDLLDPSIYNLGFEYQKQCVYKWVKLGQKLFKVK